MENPLITWEAPTCLYVHVNKYNGKKYFGITNQSVKQRWQGGNGYNETQPLFHNAIKKYGWDMFDHIVVIKNLPRFLAYEFEKYFIALYRTNNSDFGYNISAGGINSHTSNTTKQKQQMAAKNKQQVICLETKQIFNSYRHASKHFGVDMNAIKRCCKHPQKGYTSKGFHFMKLQEYQCSSPQTISKLLQTVCNYTGKPVICLETRKIYKNQKQLKQLQIASDVGDCCRLQNKSSGGFHWLFLQDYLQKSEQQIQEILESPIENNFRKKAIICLETKQIFESATIAAKVFGVGKSCFKSVCNPLKNNKTVKGKHFLYVSDYKQLSNDDIEKILNQEAGIERKKVVCLTTKTIYANCTQASKILNLRTGTLLKICNDNLFNKAIKGYCFQYLHNYRGDINKLSIATRLQYKNKSPATNIVCLNNSRIYKSILQASKATGCSQGLIKACCEHIMEQTKGFYWMYETEFKEKNNETI